LKKDKQHIHWYPGHIAKAERQLKEQLKLVDVVVEVRDARIPLSSGYTNIKKLLGDKPRLLLLNKADLVDKRELKKWTEFLESENSCPVIVTEAKNTKNISQIIKYIESLSESKIQALVQKGLLRRPARAMVVGMPNVGKSSIINKLTKSSKTKTGAKAGVTRQQQWVRINPNVELLDTPGIIPTKQDDQVVATKLAFVNSVSDNAYSVEPVTNAFLDIIKETPIYVESLLNYYKIESVDDLTIEGIANSRSWIKKGNEPDIDRTASNILKDFREGRLGLFILDCI